MIPEVKGKEIILLGTPLTVKAWAQSEFKSGDGTFLGGGLLCFPPPSNDGESPSNLIPYHSIPGGDLLLHVNGFNYCIETS